MHYYCPSTPRDWHSCRITWEGCATDYEHVATITFEDGKRAVITKKAHPSAVQVSNGPFSVGYDDYWFKNKAYDTLDDAITAAYNSRKDDPNGLAKKK